MAGWLPDPHVPVGAMAIAMNVFSLVTMLPMAFNIAGATRVGNELGMEGFFLAAILVFSFFFVASFFKLMEARPVNVFWLVTMLPTAFNIAGATRVGNKPGKPMPSAYTHSLFPSFLNN